jgi:drug/metabolite transporter (DMT)-like permease
VSRYEYFRAGLALILNDADSVHYLPLAEATVFRFLVPIVTAWACSVFLGQTFTRKELIAGLVALLGVIIIAHPPWLFGEVHDDLHPKKPSGIDKVTPTQRFIAIVVSILGVAGASGAYTMIRVIGNRAHALMSVNYFALLATVGSTIALLAIPSIGFRMPQSAREWILLIAMGILGFILQFLLTAGLQLDKSSKATSMLYVQIIFALAFDWGIWGVIPGAWSMFGGFIVICSTLWSALQKPHTKVDKKVEPDEESALLGGAIEENEAVVRRASNAA